MSLPRPEALLDKPQRTGRFNIQLLTEEIIVKTANRLVFSTAMLLMSVWAAPGAFADEPVRTETVKFYDLNVDSPAGVQALFSRIHAAAMRVCSERDPVMQAAAVSCFRKAEARAVQNLNLPQLTAYYRQKTGERSPLTIAQQR